MRQRLFQAGSPLRGTVAAATSAAASICCIGPLAIALLGVNGAILAAAFKPYRVYLLGGSLVLLASAFWSAYRRPPMRDGAACPVAAGAPAPKVPRGGRGGWEGGGGPPDTRQPGWVERGGVLCKRVDRAELFPPGSP